MCAEGVDVHAQRFRMADGVRELHFAFFRQASSHHVLGDPATHVCRAAIDFARIFSRKRAAAMSAHSAVRVNNDLAAGQAGVALRTANDEIAGRID